MAGQSSDVSLSAFIEGSPGMLRSSTSHDLEGGSDGEFDPAPSPRRRRVPLKNSTKGTSNYIFVLKGSIR